MRGVTVWELETGLWAGFLRDLADGDGEFNNLGGLTVMITYLP
jgi:hypothetical protein